MSDLMLQIGIDNLKPKAVRLLFCAVGGALALACGDPADPTADGPSETFLRFESDAGDFVGQGETHRFTLADGSWFVHTESAADRDKVNQVSFFATGDDLSWYLDFAAVAGEPLVVGAYLNAQKFNSLNRPNLDFGWMGSGCAEVVGRFVVLFLETTGDTLNRVHATFEQHCEGAEPALRGEISYVR